MQPILGDRERAGEQSPAGRGTPTRRRRKEPGHHGLVAEELDKPIDPVALFGRDAPLELEIGSGKGTFLVVESKRRPEVNFLGIEYARRYWLSAADRLRRNDCGNARVVLTEARRFLEEFLAPNSISAVHVYFPDPWPKTRHKRRRLLSSAFVELLATRMKPGSKVQIATDHREYFRAISRVIEKSSLVPALFGPTAAAAETEIVGTNFERKYRVEGRELFTLAAAKTP